MNATFLTKLNRTLDKFCKQDAPELNISASDIKKDIVLPRLGLKNNTEILVEHGVDETVCVTIGPRDWQWAIKSGRLIGSGCYLG